LDRPVRADMCSLRLLPPGQACTMTVRFTPTAPGHVEAAVAMVGDGEPHIAMVRGVGSEPATALPAPARPARGLTWRSARKSQSAQNTRNRVRLGGARCKGAPTCTVTVHTRLAVKVDGARRPYLVRGRIQKWTPARMKTRAPGHPVTVQRRLLRLISD
jgi:hypothetical protein